MDKLTVKILKQINKNKKPPHENDILERFGSSAEESLEYLKDNNYIEVITDVTGMHLDYQSGSLVPTETESGFFRVKARGKDFIQRKPWEDFDKWLTRICAIIGAITGIYSLLLHFM